MDSRDLDEDAVKMKLLPGDDHYMAFVGPPHQYDLMGAMQFRLMCALGLRGHHRVLDVGCGSLRLGRLLIPFLEKSRYVGLEPESWLVEDGVREQLGWELIRLKDVQFVFNRDFDVNGLDNFDFIMCQSIFSHTNADMFDSALKNLANALSSDGLLLLTALKPGQDGAKIGTGSGWVYPECIAHTEETLHALFRNNGFEFCELPWFHPRQTWFALSASGEKLPTEAQLMLLKGATLNVEDFLGSLD